MPYYNFKCMECESITEVKASMQEKEAGLAVECPNCKSSNTTHVFGNIATMVGSRSSAPASACGLPAGGGCANGACGLF
ncbi:MAG: hypothetical protein KDK39_07660 [Leptospiraceae bacterium]|nr:hypothetical protein [Leptospiraceae bacterium]